MTLRLATVSRLVGLSPRHTHRLLLHLGYQPVGRQKTAGRPNFSWGVRHALGLMLFSALVRKGSPVPNAEAVARNIGEGFSDESLEHILGTGRSWLMAVGGEYLPEPVTESSIHESRSMFEENVPHLHLQVKVINLAPLFAQVQEAAQAAKKASTEA